jgi:hypothetical protein
MRTDPGVAQGDGQERVIETGLDYFGARYMSSAHGRFTGTDPKQRQPTIVPHKSLPIRVAGHNDLKFSYI